MKKIFNVMKIFICMSLLTDIQRLIVYENKVVMLINLLITIGMVITIAFFRGRKQVLMILYMYIISLIPDTLAAYIVYHDIVLISFSLIVFVMIIMFLNYYKDFIDYDISDK